MNGVITKIDQRYFDSLASIGGRDGYCIREAAHAVPSDESGRVTFMYVVSRDYYKLPGG